MTSNAQATDLTPATEPRVRGAIAGKPVTLAIAAFLVLLGLYPAPLMLFHDPAWQGNVVVRQLAETRVFWIVGFAVIIAPVLLVAHLFRNVFDQMWLDVRARLGMVTDRRFMVAAAIVASTLALGSALWVFFAKPDHIGRSRSAVARPDAAARTPLAAGGSQPGVLRDRQRRRSGSLVLAVPDRRTDGARTRDAVPGDLATQRSAATAIQRQAMVSDSSGPRVCRKRSADRTLPLGTGRGNAAIA